MPSILPGFHYDIFISYRQKDNKGERWVSDFVSNLRTELESTFKEDISVYFDENPHDGLLETHIVDKSLEGKLKSLIFIPIISRTYCDEKSFAWQHEFCAFNKLAKEDRFGRELRLSNGNVSSRILSVKIHDLDSEDKVLLESELGGVLRPVEFIFRSSGVNRPLKPDDTRAENQNHTYYRDQINKVAISVKEIIHSMKSPSAQSLKEPEPRRIPIQGGIRKRNPQLLRISGGLVFAGLLVAGYFLMPGLRKSTPVPVERSIAVLPFDNLSNDPEQEYFGEGMMQEILNHLFMIGGLKIPSGTSSMHYKGSELPIREIARELNVSYILEGNISKSDDRIRIIVRLINGKDEKVLWTEDYRRAMTASDLLEIQSNVAQQVAENMKVIINPEVKKRIESKPTTNTEAYTLYLQSLNPLKIYYSRQNLERAIQLDPNFADAYALLSFYWLTRGTSGGDVERDEVLRNATPLLEKSLELDPNSSMVHRASAAMKLWFLWDFKSLDKEFQILNQLAPSEFGFNIFPDYLLATGRYKEALIYAKKFNDQEIQTSLGWAFLSVAQYFNGENEAALKTLHTALRIFPGDFFITFNSFRIFVYTGHYKDVIALSEMNYPRMDTLYIPPYKNCFLGISYFKTYDHRAFSYHLKRLLSATEKSSVGSPCFYAALVYSAIGEKEKAIKMLEKAYDKHEMEMYWLKVDPLFKPLHGDKRFQELLAKIGFN